MYSLGLGSKIIGGGLGVGAYLLRIEPGMIGYWAGS
jgi:hypothetical protein